LAAPPAGLESTRRPVAPTPAGSAATATLTRVQGKVVLDKNSDYDASRACKTG
jgi:hypothetical protein